MNSRRIIVIVASCLICLTVVLALLNWFSSKGPSKATIGNAQIVLEVAATRRQQEEGLQHRPPLPDNHGMIFVFRPTRKHVNFWMEGTVIPLDLLFLRNGKVEKIYERIQPPKIGETILQRYGCDEVSEAIEVNSGFVAFHHIAVGDPVVLDLHYDPKIIEDYADRLGKKTKLSQNSLNWKH